MAIASPAAPQGRVDAAGSWGDASATVARVSLSHVAPLSRGSPLPRPCLCSQPIHGRQRCQGAIYRNHTAGHE